MNEGGDTAGKKVVDCIRGECKETGIGDVHFLANLQVIKEPGLCSMCWLRGVGSSKFLINKIAVMVETRLGFSR